MPKPKKIQEPYIKKRVSYTEYHYNPKYGDYRVCECDHPYHRHFDSWSDWENIGCKYCRCSNFKEKELKCE